MCQWVLPHVVDLLKRCPYPLWRGRRAHADVHADQAGGEAAVLWLAVRSRRPCDPGLHARGVEAGWVVVRPHLFPGELDLNRTMLRVSLIWGEVDLVVVLALAECFLACQVVERVADDVIELLVVHHGFVSHPIAVLIGQRTGEGLEVVLGRSLLAPSRLGLFQLKGP